MIAALALLLAAADAPQPIDRRPPVDHCAADASFAAFRAELLDAIERKDAAFILDVAAEDISASFGGHDDRAAFAELWGLDRPEESGLWEALGDTLRLGCMVSDDGARVAPSFFLQQGEGDDPFETFLAVVPGAPLRVAPEADAEIVARLDWDVLTWLGGDEHWYHMRMADGRTGYVRAAHARSAVDYRAFFERIDGRWRMTAFIAGD